MTRTRHKHADQNSNRRVVSSVSTFQVRCPFPEPYPRCQAALAPPFKLIGVSLTQKKFILQFCLARFGCFCFAVSTLQSGLRLQYGHVPSGGRGAFSRLLRVYECSHRLFFYKAFQFFFSLLYHLVVERVWLLLCSAACTQRRSVQESSIVVSTAQKSYHPP